MISLAPAPTAAGWRVGYLALGALVLVVGQAAIGLVLRQRQPRASIAAPDPVAAGIPFARAVATWRFAASLGIAGFGAGALNALFTHLVPMALDRGLPATNGAATMAIMALTGSAWQLVFGALLDRSGTPRIMAPVFLLAIVGVVLLAEAPTTLARDIGAVIAGLGLGTEYASIPFLLSRYFGLRAFGAINGVVSGINAVVIGAAPALVDLAYDRTGSYRAGVACAVIALAISACLALALPRFGPVRGSMRARAVRSG